MKKALLARRTIILVSVLILLNFTSPVFAACPPIFSPPSYTVIPDDDVQAFLTYSEPDRVETLVIQPAFSGNATEFGMVMPLPNRPEINEAQEDIFDVLMEYTTPDFKKTSGDFMFRSGGSSSRVQEVVVIEEKDVGDFKTTLLTAGNAEDLVEWLNERGFEYTQEDLANFEYYVEKGGYYFVAMKVNMNEADINSAGEINGKLRPIEFVFESEYPMLPLRIMAHDMDPMSFTLYTLGVFPYYVPGADTIFMDKLDRLNQDDFIAELQDSDFLTALYDQTAGTVSWEQFIQDLKLSHNLPLSDKAKLGSAFWDMYDPLDKWLVRMNVLFDPRQIEKNLLLERLPIIDGSIHPLDKLVLPPSSTIFNGVKVVISKPVIINPELLPPGSGVSSEHASILQYMTVFGEVMSYHDQAMQGIPSQSIECKPAMHLILKPDGLNTACVKDSSIQTLTERGWQPSTMRSSEMERLS